jgi:hypothetical protein
MIESADDGLSFGGGAKNSLGARELGRVEPEILGNAATIYSRHELSFFLIF